MAKSITFLLIALAVFSALITGFNIFYYSLGTEYGQTGITNLSVLNKTAQLGLFTQNIKTNLSQNQGLLESAGTDVALVWGVITMLPSLPGTFDTLTTEASGVSPIPIPPFFTILLGTIITILVIAAIIAFFTYREV